jgi:subtilisin family serine protease
MLRVARAAVRELATIAADPRVVLWRPAYDHATGLGVRVALIDTGVDWTQPIFGQVALSVRDFAGTAAAMDPTGHGTRSAALLLVGDETGPALAGGVVLTVCKAVGTGPRAVAHAIDWAAARNVLIVLPFGRAVGDAKVAAALRAAREAGVEVLAAAGNRGPDAVLFPASGPGVVAVTGAGPDGTVLPECPSGIGVDCIAPGLVRCPLGTGPARGSSVAAVIAAGVRALEHEIRSSRRHGYGW